MNSSIWQRLGTIACACLILIGAKAQAQEQNAVLTGRVTSESGTPIAAANVYITEMNISARTNEEGRYTITIPAARVTGQAVVLRVRSVTFVPQSRNITLTAGTQTFDFALANDFTRLTDVVVTGVTGATERVKVPFTVARVDSSQMPVLGVNPLSQLQGKVAGATISSVSGRPGSTPSVILRGPTSINATGRGQEPLYIVDGVILQGSNPLGDINANDIESVEIVKGAAAASLYGSRAGAGVIAITTRRGQATDGVSFNVRQEVGLNDIERDFGIARHHTWLLDESGTRFCAQNEYIAGGNKVCARSIDYNEEVARINNKPGDFTPSTVAFPVDPGAVTSGGILRRAFLTNPWPGRSYNAVDQLVDPKPLTITDVSMNGRSGGTSFFTSLNYTGQGGAITGLDGLRRLGGRVNVGQTIGEEWDIQLNSYFSRSTADGLNEEDGDGSGFFRLTRVPGIVDITQRDTLGRLYIRTNLGAGGVQNENPLYPFSTSEREDVRYRYTGGITTKYTPLDWVDVEGNFSLDRLNTNFRQFNNRGFRTTGPDAQTNNGLIFNGVSNDQSFNASLQTTIRRELASELLARFNFRALFERQDFDTRDLYGERLKVSGVDAAENATDQQTISSASNSTRQGSFSGGVFFDFKDRYTADFLVRRDGSSRFGPEQRWQTYGRASAAWLASREAWWPSSVVSQFTVRSSLGTAGNVPRFSAQYETYDIGAGGTLSQATLGNKDLKPEVVTEWESGVEMELFERLGLTVVYAAAESKNQILPVAVSVSTGFPNQWQNAGTLESKTWEVSLSAPFIQREDLQWSGRLNYSSNRTHITQLDVPPFALDPGATNTGSFLRVEEGLRFGTIFGREFVRKCSQLPTGFSDDCGSSTSDFQRNDEGYIVYTGGHSPGAGITDNLWSTRLPADQAPWGVQASWGNPIVIRDESGSGQQRPLGNVLPDFQLGFSQNFTWRRLGAFALLDGKFGQKVYNQGRHWSYLDFISDDVDQTGKSLQSAKPIAYYYRAPQPDNQNGLGGFYDVLGPNSRFVEDASFVKLREVSLSYRLGQMSGGDWSLTLIGRNLKTWTDYQGFDPEVGLTNNSTFNTTGSGVLNAVDAFSFPNLRSFSFVVSTRF
jgi:TonB-linked SusC/RagA family outer membrane protein